MSRTHDAPHLSDTLGKLQSSVSAFGKWPATASRVRRAASVHPGVFGTEFLIALTALPQDWWPRDDQGRSGLAMLVTLTKDIADHLWHYDFLAGGHPDWLGHLRDTLGPTGPNFMDHADAADGVLDMVRAFERQVVLPALNREGLTVEQTTFYNRPTLAGCVAAALLLGDKRLKAMLELSTEWHEARDGIDGAILPGTAPGMSWPVPFPVLRAPNGVVALGLTTAEELRAEGAAGSRDGITGLDHCVGGYAAAVAAGTSSLLSFRIERDGVLERLSTLSFRLVGNRLETLEHKGRGNGPVPPEAEAAVRWLRGEIHHGRLTAAQAWSSHRWHEVPWLDDIQYDWGDGAAFAAAVDAWGPLLPRPLRDTALLTDAVVREAARIVRHRVPGGEGALTGGRLLPSTVPCWVGPTRPAPVPGRMEGILRRPLALPATVRDLVVAGHRDPRIHLAAKGVAAATVAVMVLTGIACAQAAAVAMLGAGASVGMPLVLGMGAAGFVGTWSLASVATLAVEAAGRWRWSRRLGRA